MHFILKCNFLLLKRDKCIALEMKHTWDALFCTSAQQEEKKCLGGRPFPISSLLCPSATFRASSAIKRWRCLCRRTGNPLRFGRGGFYSPLTYTTIVSHVTNITNRKTRGECLYLLKSYPYLVSYLYFGDFFYSFYINVLP